MAAASGIPKTMLYRRLKSGELRVHSNTVKPTLTEVNMESRVRFCMSHINFNSGRFQDMMDVIHIDEKWFYLCQNKRTYYLLVGEGDPHRTTKSKWFTTKVMLLSAVACPHHDTHRNQLFDGKLGIWPFITVEPAQRSSRNRARGMLMTKPVTSVTNVEYWQFILEKVLPAIEEKWPRNQQRTIKLQHDNTKPHIQNDDPQFQEAV